MKQIIQNYSTGELVQAEVPVPVCTPDTLIVANMASLISIGTERSVIELGKKSILGKARARPDLVRRFMEKAKNEGVVKTFNEALGRLDSATPLGYSSAGIVLEAGKDIHDFSRGDRVSCIGTGYASHAEYIRVPCNLCCRLPDNLSFEEGAFGMLGIIALHGVHCAQLSFGASVGVIGLGLLGLLTVQLLKAYGCRVIAADIDAAKADKARQLGAELALPVGTDEQTELFKKACNSLTGGAGLDAVILTVATRSADPVHLAVDIARFKGKIVVTGVADIHPHRHDMWHKEVEMIVSKAGGPGIFDPAYERRGIDYPPGYVRWTENRNLEEFLRLVSIRRIDVRQLISHRFTIQDALTAYGDILKSNGAQPIGIILQYRHSPPAPRIREIILPPPSRKNGSRRRINLGIIGAGLFGKALLLPALKRVPDFRFSALASASGANAYHIARKYRIASCTTDYREILKQPDIEAVLIASPHSLHAAMVMGALEAGKHVFVEKPLCINETELSRIMQQQAESGSLCLQVGYNRRFSRHAARISEHLAGRREPLVISYRVNAGYIPADHWVHSREEGGGRIIGEICHFVDLMQFFTTEDPVHVSAERISGNHGIMIGNDNVAINIKFNRGSIGSIVYTAAGDRSFPREQIDIFFDGCVISCSDFRMTTFHCNGRKRVFKTFNQDMGYVNELRHFADQIRGRTEPLLTPTETFISTQAVFSIAESLRKNAHTAVTLPHAI
jgi:predicted dehydrogenase/threonine dehydrogenase-like Zn-dependent dehydrogenase